MLPLGSDCFANVHIFSKVGLKNAVKRCSKWTVNDYAVTGLSLFSQRVDEGFKSSLWVTPSNLHGISNVSAIGKGRIALHCPSPMFLRSGCAFPLLLLLLEQKQNRSDEKSQFVNSSEPNSKCHLSFLS